MSLTEILAALISGDMSEEEVVAETYKAYTGIEISPEEAKRIMMEENKNDKKRSR